MYEQVINLLRQAFDRWIAAEGISYPEGITLHLSRPPSPRMGDYASNLPLLLAERTKRNPREIAERLAKTIKEIEDPAIDEVEVAGNGFLNFRVKTSFWLKMIQTVRERGILCAAVLPPAGKRPRINVEFVSANPTGPLHVGHGRGAVIGDAIVRVLRAAGMETTSEYYVNDRGRQVHALGASIHYRYNRLFDPTFPEPEWEDWYRGEYVEDIAKKLKDLHGDTLLGRPPEDPIFKDFGVESMLARIKDDLESLGIHFDVWFRETSLVEAVEQTIQALESKGYAHRNPDGSIAFKYKGNGTEKTEDSETEDKERILQKRDGDFTYFATDIPYHLNKIERGFGMLINVWGADHHGYIPRMKAALRAFGHDPEMLKVILVQMVSLSRAGVPVKMSKRAGDFVTMREIVDEVGSDAFRFIFLTRRPDSQFEFDIEVAKKRNLDNPVFHVQYGHARLCSILRRARTMYGLDLEKLDSVEELRILERWAILEEELQILKEALRAGEVYADAARTLQPHRVATFLMNLSQNLQSYYTTRWRIHRDPVLPPASAGGAQGTLPEGWDINKTMARLLWIDAVKIVMKNALDLLGIEAPERMERLEGLEEETGI